MELVLKNDGGFALLARIAASNWTTAIVALFAISRVIYLIETGRTANALAFVLGMAVVMALVIARWLAGWMRRRS